MPLTELAVLDRGFVKLVDHMGSDLSVVNAARVSFGKRKEVYDEADGKLIAYLAEHDHTSPFRHTAMTFHVKAPIFVFRQWMKHRISSEFNEISGRYVEFPEDEFFVPETFRRQAKVNKQGSEGTVEGDAGDQAHAIFLETCRSAVAQYKKLIGLGVCREQARCILPLGLYSEVYWTVSLQAAAHFIRLRTDAHAQWEIQQYAHAVRRMVEELYPNALKALLENARP
ncbi:FAD-dependent thymidylate synthase [Mesoterricola silvestris]|uniref:Flavin-dependent thymidylate synthase n=1 Tax=Mesoterricola silvestris TaxID=2927979 RepID=A0AA48GSJ7_9BACT|nr:FAD-dependent thymidylate synthase [Mesoterricola silvestris]BDU74890.1 flavin-dependent thymidylate synthase [Mesoterricola silvestris]